MSSMSKPYDKPAIIDSREIDPKPDSCQQGDEASAPESTATSRPTGRDHLKVVKR